MTRASHHGIRWFLAKEKTVATIKSSEFWDEEFETAKSMKIIELRKDNVISDALAWIGDVRGKRVLDLGCGSGQSSLRLAEAGAEVIALDSSVNGIARLREQAAARGLPVEAIVGDAFEVERYGPFDAIVGLMILHHIEPLDAFVDVLKRSLRLGGRCFFWENNAVPLLMWFRRNAVGRMGIPKHGDSDEIPLARSEIRLFERAFRTEVEYPELFLFRLASVYLLNDRATSAFELLDALMYRLPPMRPLSYRQYVKLAT